MIAVAKGGVLFDTFWGDMTHSLHGCDVIAKFQGNIHSMTEVLDRSYYRNEDIVDMNHSNNTRAKVYLKKGAMKNVGVMAAHVAYKITECEREIKFAEDKIVRLRADASAILDGRADDVYF